jgi:NADH:ubiquinone oxidoreductase subunit 4 (subunit M)
MLQNSLIYISALPLFGVLLLIFIPSTNSTLLKVTALNFSSLPFLGLLLVWAFFKKSMAQFQFVTKIYWVPFFKLESYIRS